MEKTYEYHGEAPAAAERANHYGMKKHVVRYRLEQRPDDASDEEWPQGMTHRSLSVTLMPGHWTYDDIVAAVVTAEYPGDRMQAVVNNYLLDPSNEDTKAEFDEMQQWRAKAKSLAKECLALFPEGE